MGNSSVWTHTQADAERANQRLKGLERESATFAEAKVAAQAGGGSAGRIRTYDQPVNSRLLYH
jgi:hypothetical protein